MSYINKVCHKLSKAWESNDHKKIDELLKEFARVHRGQKPKKPKKPKEKK